MSPFDAAWRLLKEDSLDPEERTPIKDELLNDKFPSAGPYWTLNDRQKRIADTIMDLPDEAGGAAYLSSEGWSGYDFDHLFAEGHETVPDQEYDRLEAALRYFKDYIKDHMAHPDTDKSPEFLDDDNSDHPEHPWAMARNMAYRETEPYDGFSEKFQDLNKSEKHPGNQTPGVHRAAPELKPKRKYFPTTLVHEDATEGIQRRVNPFKEEEGTFEGLPFKDDFKRSEPMNLAWRLLKGPEDFDEIQDDLERSKTEGRRSFPEGRKKQRSMGSGSTEEEHEPRERPNARNRAPSLEATEAFYDSLELHPGSRGHEINTLRNEAGPRSHPPQFGTFMPLDTKEYIFEEDAENILSQEPPLGPDDRMRDVALRRESLSEVPTFAQTPFNPLTGFTRSEPMDLAFRLLKRQAELRQTELGEHHEDFPSSHGPVTEYHATMDMPSVMQQGIDPPPKRRSKKYYPPEMRRNIPDQVTYTTPNKKAAEEFLARRAQQLGIDEDNTGIVGVRAGGLSEPITQVESGFGGDDMLTHVRAGGISRNRIVPMIKTK